MIYIMCQITVSATLQLDLFSDDYNNIPELYDQIVFTETEK